MKIDILGDSRSLSERNLRGTLFFSKETNK